MPRGLPRLGGECEWAGRPLTLSAFKLTRKRIYWKDDDSILEGKPYGD